METNKRVLAIRLAVHLSILALAGCGGSSDSGGPDDDGPDEMALLEVSNGFGQVLPHRIRLIGDDGNPTNVMVSVTRFEDLQDNLRPDNRLQPPPTFPSTAVLPSGAPGNHFLYARFSRPLDLDTVLDGSVGADANNGLAGSVVVLAIDPLTGDASPLEGRAFVGGRTHAGQVQDGRFPLQRWVAPDGSGGAQALVVDAGLPGVGFPGTESAFAGAGDLLSRDCLVFVADRDDDLATHDTFPEGVQIVMRISAAVHATDGEPFGSQAVAATTVGVDVLSPEAATEPPTDTLAVVPADGTFDVDPMTTIRVRFREPVHPLAVGPLEGSQPGLGSAIKVKFGPETSRTELPFTVRPIAVLDLTTFEILPGFPFPGSGPHGDCGGLNRIDLEVHPGTLEDLAPTPNVNLLGGSAHFFTGAGPGLVNAPVTPDAILVGRAGPAPSLSIQDINGLGQSTGDPTFDATGATTANHHSNFPYNQNLPQGAKLRPPIFQGSCTLDGGSAGAFTLTKDTNLDDRLVRPPLVQSIHDALLGHTLDRTFNSAPVFGCQAGGGNECAANGLQEVSVSMLTNTVTFILLNPQHRAEGTGNNVSMAPHPNPPPLHFPPLCNAPFLLGREPTSLDNIVLDGLNNLVGPGNPFHDPATGKPPTGLPSKEQNTWFLGPSMPTTQPCTRYHLRQQIGNFLYVIDRVRAEIVVLNSNRMTVIERIQVPDPTALAISPNMDYLAVTNQLANSVTFLDIDPGSSTFHKVLKSVTVGSAPRGIAWDPGNEDILVCNEGDGSMSILSATSLEVRRLISASLTKPFDVVITPRQQAHGFARNVYFAYILDRTGRVALFESGPNGVNGWGFDDVIGVAPFTFHQPKTLQPDHVDLRGAVWVLHEGKIDLASGEAGPAGEGACSKLTIESALTGQLPLNGPFPGLRGISFAVDASLGEETLSGIPVDIAFDNLRNIAVFPNVTTPFSAGAPIPVNGKNLVKAPAGPVRNANTPSYAFLAIPNSNQGGGVIDVLAYDSAGLPRIDTNPFDPGVQSVPASHVTVLADYFRQ